MRMRNGIAVVVSLMVATWLCTAQAQPAAGDKPADQAAGPGGVPKPPAENDLFKKSAGTWTCQGTAKSPDGQEMKYKSSWSVKPALGGHWYSLVYKRSKMGPLPPFEGNATLGYNVVEKKYTFVGFDSLGGWVNLASDDGAVYSGEGSPMGRKGPVKFTFAAGKDKKGEESDKLFDVTLDFGGAGSSENCKK